MSEADEQRAVIEWCAWKRVPVFHIPNGGSRHPAEAAHSKAFLQPTSQKHHDAQEGNTTS